MNWETMIRQAVKTSGLTMYAISKRSGVAYPRVNVFVNGGGLSLHNAELISKAVGLELRKRKGR